MLFQESFPQVSMKYTFIAFKFDDITGYCYSRLAILTCPKMFALSHGKEVDYSNITLNNLPDFCSHCECPNLLSLASTQAVTWFVKFLMGLSVDFSGSLSHITLGLHLSAVRSY
jgi:hypothetical protein